MTCEEVLAVYRLDSSSDHAKLHMDTFRNLHQGTIGGEEMINKFKEVSTGQKVPKQ